MVNEMWNKAKNFHGHECPGLAIGVKVCEAIMKKLNIKNSKDEEIVCIVENDACGIDAIQAILGCTIGKGNLIYRNTGKQVYSIFNRKNNESIRIYFKQSFEKKERNEFQKYILESDIDAIFEFSNTNIEIPEKARLFKNEICKKCGESMPEHKAHIENGEIVCVDCLDEYLRGW